jgi:hypothetical protein
LHSLTGRSDRYGVRNQPDSAGDSEQSRVPRSPDHEHAAIGCAIRLRDLFLSLMTRNAPQAPPFPYPFRDHCRSFDLISFFFSHMLFLLVTVRATPAKDSASSLTGAFLISTSLRIIAFSVSRSPLDTTCYIHVTFSTSLESPDHQCPRPRLHSPPPLHSTPQLTMLRLKTEKLLSTTPAQEQWTGTARLSLNIIINMFCALSERLLK